MWASRKYSFPVIVLTLAFSFCWRSMDWGVGAISINRTVDDTSQLFVYHPSQSWRACSTLGQSSDSPAAAHLQRTWHQPVRAPSSDLPNTGASEFPCGRPDPARMSGSAIEDHVPSVTANFSFVGSAIYLYSIIPLGQHVDVSTKLDGTLTAIFTHDGNVTVFDQLFGIHIFSISGLPDNEHTLSITVNPGSTIMLDYAVYTHDDETAGDRTTHSRYIVPRSLFTRDTSQGNNRKDALTFGLAIGFSVGVLALLGAGVAISLFRRRKIAERRDRLEREQHTAIYANTNGPEIVMQGPAPFIPRYFPGTIAPHPDPPPYDPRDVPLPPSLSSHSRGEEGDGTALHADTFPGLTAHSVDDAEADISPPTPPGLESISDARHSAGERSASASKFRLHSG
ncbi:hypothetical protein HYDPIDRAFT_112340 [Hydnomerulius pinastri MD-312]|uniref:Transmembrane protein n=1 Tax=Hydnomerulius pinastri MD-312 TaxID=994086 RepID=A0A0C9W9E2_9AGAM|nr:hypothetical protein HYDPIDRAFT_112340 [Hydnomerulius pinastri MD-312]